MDFSRIKDVNAIIIQDFQDERHLLMRSLDGVVKKGWYSLVIEIVMGNASGCKMAYTMLSNRFN